jgi:hypothetical protein
MGCIEFLTPFCVVTLSVWAAVVRLMPQRFARDSFVVTNPLVVVLVAAIDGIDNKFVSSKVGQNSARYDMKGSVASANIVLS